MVGSELFRYSIRNMRIFDISALFLCRLLRCNGSTVIQVGRPSNMPQAKPIIERIMEESTFYNRIYAASIHQDLTEADVQR